MRKFMIFSCLLAGIIMTMSSCKKDDEEPPSGAATISAVTISSPSIGVGVISGNTVTITLPFGSDISNVVGTVTLASGASISPNLSNGIDFSNGPVDFTVTNGSNTTVYTFEVDLGGDPMRLALVGDAATVGELNEEMSAAYNWALGEYGAVARYIPFSDLDADAIESATAIWFHYSEFNDNRDLPASATGATALNAISDFYEAGGNLLLSTHASQYLVDLGRISADWGPTDGGSGETSFDNPDNWGVGYKLNDLYEGGNNFNHPMFEDISFTDVSFDGVDYDAMMMIDGGSKRDAAYFWFGYNVPPVIAQFDDNGDGSINGYDTDGDGIEDTHDLDTNGDGVFNNDDDVLAVKNYFESNTNSVVRGSFEWDPVANGVEFYTVTEWNPEGNIQGRAIVISAGCYEWWQNDGDPNDFQGNVETWTANALGYLGVN